ncbi:aminopeptidase N C-terminal domain-containing protein [Candidatus Peregrinibacteria bacterium]|nr:aminopeptidase N C-terminal domain-containing protein [Candidatus Peregrinibacteria bacterium]
MKARKLKNVCLSYLCALQDTHIQLAKDQFENPECGSDELIALKILCESEEERKGALATYFERWKEEPIGVDQWMEMQVQIDDPEAIAMAKKIVTSESFSYEVPSRAFSVIRGLIQNGAYFHSQEGYEFIADEILRIENETLAILLMKSAFRDLPNLEARLQDHIKTQLQKIDNSHSGEAVRQYAQKMLRENFPEEKK